MQNNTDHTKKKQPAVLQATFILLIATGLFLFAVLFRFRCPSEFILGIPCPMCGITRALKALLSGRVRAAFYYHPLWPVMVLSFLLYLLYVSGVIRLKQKVFNACCYGLAILLAACFVIRHVSGSPVVKTHFETSLLGTILSFAAHF